MSITDDTRTIPALLGNTATKQVRTFTITRQGAAIVLGLTFVLGLACGLQGTTPPATAATPPGVTAPAPAPAAEVSPKG